MRDIDMARTGFQPGRAASLSFVVSPMKADLEKQQQ
jgi:hypothetical protein